MTPFSADPTGLERTLLDADGYLFDFDGVVVDSELERDGIMRELLGTFGVEYAPSERDRVKPMLAGTSLYVGCQILISEFSLPTTPEALEHARDDAINALYRERVDFVPGFKSFFKRLRECTDAPVAVGTGLEREMFDLADKRLGIRELFDGHVYFGQEVANQKPAPDIYLHCASQLDCDPCRCKVFEDAPLGMVAGLGAGCSVYAITRTFREELLRRKTRAEQRTSYPVWFFDDYAMLLE